MTTTPFEHSPLDPSDPRAIQVLHLLPSRDLEAPVHCELRHTSLDQDVQYEAVSYTWGKPEPGHTVFVNGSYTLDVTPNCIGALKSFRGRFLRRTLWVDAICIDQRDNDISRQERSRQVAIMDGVYHKAQKVLVWLGHEEATSARTISKLKRMARLKAVAQAAGGSFLSDMADVASAGLIQYDDDSKPDADPRYHALASMIHSPWAYRVWTLQEQVLARKCEAYQGRQSVPLPSIQGRQLEDAIESLTDGQGYFVHVLRNFTQKSCQLYDTLPPGSQQHNDSIAKPLLDGVFMLQATQPIDKIYGLYSILTTHCNLPLAAPDYNKTAEQVFEETTCTWIHSRGDLSILKLATRPESIHNLPSWVPAWHQQHPKFSRNIGLDDPENSRFNIGGHFNWDYSYDIVTPKAERPSNQPRETDNHVSVASLLSPGKLCVHSARFAGRVTHAIGPEESLGWRSIGLEFLARHLDWYRSLRDFIFPGDTEREEAINELFRSVLLPGPLNDTPAENVSQERLFGSFRAWFDFVSYLAETSQPSHSRLLEGSDESHDRESLNLYRKVLGSSTNEDAAKVLENGYEGDIRGMESLIKLADDIRETLKNVKIMRNHCLCILDNDNMLAVTDYWCQEGDEIFVFPGTDTPFVLRREPDGDYYRLVGPALVDRLFRVGYQEWRSEGADLRDIVLI